MISRNALCKPLHSLSRSATELPSSLPSNYSHPSLSLLYSCNNLKSLLQIHARLILSGSNPNNITSTHLMNSYVLFQKSGFAGLVFDSTQNPDGLLCKSMIRAYTRSNQHKEALKMYHYMLGEKSIEPDKFTFTFVLKAFTGLLDLEAGVLVIKEIVGKRLESDVFIGTGLIDMYCKMGDVICAREVFGKIPNKDVVAWNAMIAGFSQSSDPREALGCFKSMQLDGLLEPNSVSLLNLFPAVSKLLDIKACKSFMGICLGGTFRLLF